MFIVSFNLLLDKMKAAVHQLDGKKRSTKVDKKLILAFQPARDIMLKHILYPKHKVETFDLTARENKLKHRHIQKINNIFDKYKNCETLPDLVLEKSPISEFHDDNDTIFFNKLHSVN